MDATQERVLVDRATAAVTARTVLASVDLLVEQGLAPETCRSIVAHARLLSGPADGLDEWTVADSVGRLRELLAVVPGPTAAVLRTWFHECARRVG